MFPAKSLLVLCCFIHIFSSKDIGLMRTLNRFNTKEKEKDKEKLLKDLNKCRRAVKYGATNMVEVRWSDELADLALSWGVMCNLTDPYNEFVSMYDGMGVSYSKYAGSSQITKWCKEFKLKMNYQKPCSTFGKCGKLFNIIWHSTEEVGCSVTKCPALNIVCVFRPGGGIIGEFPYEPGTWCSSCPFKTNVCNDKLCSYSRAEHRLSWLYEWLTIVLCTMLLTMIQIYVPG